MDLTVTVRIDLSDRLLECLTALRALLGAASAISRLPPEPASWR